MHGAVWPVGVGSRAGDRDQGAASLCSPLKGTKEQEEREKNVPWGQPPPSQRMLREGRIQPCHRTGSAEQSWGWTGQDWASAAPKEGVGGTEQQAGSGESSRDLRLRAGCEGGDDKGPAIHLGLAPGGTGEQVEGLGARMC